MVKYSLNLDDVFGSLANPVRRDILQRVSGGEQTISALADAYNISMAAISKHLTVLEKAQLIVRRKQGRERFVHLSPAAIQEASRYLNFYEQYWTNQLDALEKHLTK